ncbi:phosphatidylinositol phosphatase PTPRQ-like [Mercenaria mercenaria]|uniref:phosphatidylinositol phosphatase PTPRQ-like n=1 Tax=Mercenaria mercenaria TaxID=6596 RepID=UPI00234E3A45|nr:phosphatidylinositol phosphatase PTPRQ-like [Mercenaria mercenaria]
MSFGSCCSTGLMGIYVSTSAASWLCFVVLLHLMIHTAKGSSTTTTTTAAPASSSTEKEEPKSSTTTSSPTLSTTSSSGSATTEAPALGVDCANKNESWCSTAISGAVECKDDTCQCQSGYFQSNATTCTSVLELVPVDMNISDVTVTSFNVSWLHNDSVKDLDLTHSVIAKSTESGVENEVMCNVTSSTTASCSELLPGNNYKVTITATYNSTVSGIAELEESTYPDMPGALNDTLSNFTAPDVTLVWTGSSGKVDNYLVKVTQSDGSVQNENTPDNRTMIVIRSLEAGKVYDVTIIASSHSKASLERIATFTTVSDVPGPPTNVTVEEVTNNSIKISWRETDKPNGVIRAHRVCVKYRFYIDDSYNNYTCEDTSANASEYKISSLTAERKGITLNNMRIFSDFIGTFYWFDVSTVNDVSISSNASVNQRTNESVPAKVSDLDAKSYDSSVMVTWNRPSQPNGNITTYRVYWMDIAGQGNCTVYLTSPKSSEMNNSCDHNITEPSNITVNQKNLNYTIINLEPHTEYVIRVQAYTAVGAGAITSINQRTSIAVPEPVTNVVAETLNATAVNVTWVIPSVNPGPVNYTVTTNNAVDNTASSQSCSVEDYLMSSCEVSGLEEYWMYNFNVVASTEAGTSSPAVSNNVTTDEAEPGPVLNVSYVLYNTKTGCDATKANVSWREPGLYDRNSLIISYVLWSVQSPQKEHVVSKPDRYSEDNRLFEEDIMDLKPQFDYTWEISARTSGEKTGQSSSLSFTTGVCAPPDWTDSNLESVKEKRSTTTTLTIVLPSSFFKKTQQGEIQEKGLIVLPRESQHFENTQAIKYEKISGWKNAKASKFKEDYKINIARAVEEEFTIGKETVCSGFCNGPLPEQFSFKVAAYACTKRTGTLLCTISSPLGPFATQATPPPPPRGSSQTTTIIILSIILFLSICVACFIFLWYKEVIDP